MICAAALASCAESKPPPKSPGPTQAPGYQPSPITDKAADFAGTCSWGRAPGNPRSYRVRLRVKRRASGTVLVRSSAVFDLSDESNIMGELAADSIVFGDGPVYDGQTNRRGYAILVRGNTGRVCRGYVTETSVLVE